MTSDGGTPVRTKLNALTSLRFLAAALIVLHHSQGFFGLPQRLPFALDNAVSFFFVLSGFILTHVYPSLRGSERQRFLAARVARIWPAHAATFLLLLALLPSARSQFSIKTALVNLLMVHSWIPLWAVFFSYNSPSWSISTEFTFYLLFPALIRDWQRTWRWKVALSFLVLCGMIALSHALSLPALPPSPGRTGLSSVGLIYVHPLARLFEFTLGMSAALAWQRLSPRWRLGTGAATALEVLALTLLAMAMYCAAGPRAVAQHVPRPGVAAGVWLGHGGISCLFSAALILIMALERGWVSRLLSWPLLVGLGEISYSVYLVHQVFIRVYSEHSRVFSFLPGWLVYAAFWIVTLAAARALWFYVECPCRELVRKMERSPRSGALAGSRVIEPPGPCMEPAGDR